MGFFPYVGLTFSCRLMAIQKYKPYNVQLLETKLSHTYKSFWNIFVWAFSCKYKRIWSSVEYRMFPPQHLIYHSWDNSEKHMTEMEIHRNRDERDERERPHRWHFKSYTIPRREFQIKLFQNIALQPQLKQEQYLPTVTFILPWCFLTDFQLQLLFLCLFIYMI